MRSLFLTVFILLLLTGLKSQENLIVLKSIDDIYHLNTKEKPIVIKNKKELQKISKYNTDIDSILKHVDFNLENLVVIYFNHSGPSHCNKIYYEYFLKDSAEKSTVILKPHIVGQNQAMRHKWIFLMIPKHYHLQNVFQVVDEKHYVNFQSKEDIDNICNYLKLKFKSQ